MKYIKLYEEFNSFELNKEQKAFLDRFAKRRWKLNKKSGLIDIDCNFDCSDQNLTSFLGIKFGEVSGDFFCSSNNLTSLEGCPIIVNDNFECLNNALTSLQGCPNNVGGSVNCSYNHLTSLEGCSNIIGVCFNCSFNKLTSLQGCPSSVGGHFDCCNNRLSSLKGCPTDIGADFDCYMNQLTSLKGCPTNIGGKIFSHYNVISEEGIELVINNVTENKDYQTGLILSLAELDENDLGYLTKDLEYSEEFEYAIRNNHKSEFLINILKEYNKEIYDKLSFVDKDKSDKMHDMGFND